MTEEELREIELRCGKADGEISLKMHIHPDDVRCLIAEVRRLNEELEDSLARIECYAFDDRD